MRKKFCPRGHAILPRTTKHTLLAVATATLRAACGRLCRSAPFRVQGSRYEVLNFVTRGTRCMPPVTEQFTDDVFLSHSAKDKAVVRSPSLSASNGERAGVRCRSLRLAERLQADGVKVWFDEWVLKPGDSIEKNQSKTAKIEEGLERSRVLVLCMSVHAFGSDWAQLESGTLRTGQRPFRDPLNKERRFLPLRHPNPSTPSNPHP